VTRRTADLRPIRLALAVALAITPLLACTCVDSTSESQRDVGTVHTQNGDLRVEISLSHHPFDFGRVMWDTQHSYHVNAQIHETEGVALIPVGLSSGEVPAQRLGRGDSGSAMRALFDRVTFETCRHGDNTVYSVHDPDEARRHWRVIYPVGDDTLVHDSFASAAATCAQTAGDIPTLAAQLEEKMAHNHADVCELFDRIGDRPRAIACLLRNGGSASLRTSIETAVVSGEAHADLLEGVRQTGTERYANAELANELLRHVPEEERRAFVMERVEACRTNANECGPGLVRILAMAASGLDDATCNAVIELAGVFLAAEGTASALRALEALRFTQSCGDDALRAPLIRAGLARESLDPPPRGMRSEDCPGDYALVRTPPALTECRSLPRFSGAWLATHCDGESVAAAEALLTPERVSRLWTTDAVTDGALRVLARCAPDRWRALIGDHERAPRLEAYHRPIE
jgi:hypothetical protein